MTTTRTPLTGRRLNFNSEYGQGGQQQKVLDYSYTNDDNDFLFRRTPYNQRRAQTEEPVFSSQTRFPESMGERPLLLKLSQEQEELQAAAKRTKSTDSDPYDDDYQPTYMDVDNPVASIQLGTIRERNPQPFLPPTPPSTATSSSSTMPRFMMSTPAMACRTSSTTTARPVAPPARRSSSTTTASSPKQIRGINKSPLSFIAKEFQLGRPTKGPFYAGGPESRVFKDRMAHYAKADAEAMMTTATRSPSLQSVFSSSMLSERRQENDQQRHRVEIYGIVERLYVNGRLAWPS